VNDAPRLAREPGMVAATHGSADASPFARCEVFDDIEAARAPWAEMDELGCASPYQGFGFVEAWVLTTGRARAIVPMIVVGRDNAGRVNALLPLGRSRRSGVWTAEFLGGADANFKMGLFRAGLDIESRAIVGLLRLAARMTTPHVDLFWLTNQPLSWQGGLNPMAATRHRPSPSFGHKTALTKDFDGWFKSHHSKDARRKLKKKLSKLNELGKVSHIVARDSGSARKILAAFMVQKRGRMHALGAPNVYEEPHTAQFFEMAATKIVRGSPILELHALMSDERIVATFGALAHTDRFCGMLISYDSDPKTSRCSPGQLLILEVIRDLSARGVATFDLGVGEARYKDANCEAEEPLFDAAIAVTTVGLIFGECALLRQRVKRWVKRTPWVWRLADAVRRRAFLLNAGTRQPHDGAP
jgi:CelD/BcsL family acetyltransferase involved in cellulose biosynthesis